MNCKTCNYALWNLPSRACPECGSAFKPSDFEFRTSAVKFCCPHCMQSYYGTGINGHLVPRAFNCVKCGQAVDMDEMIVLPTDGVDERDTQPNRVNWPDRHTCGFWKSYFVTLGRSMGTPQRCMEAAPPTSSLASAWWFSMFTDLLILIIGYGAWALFIGLMAFSAGGGGRGGGAGAIGFVFGCAGAMIGGVLLLGQVWTLLHGATAHAVLAVSGPSEHGMGRTMQAAWYAAGPRIICAIPCVSFYLIPVGWVWSGVSLILMLIKAQKVSVLRAIIAGALLPVLSFLAIGGFFAWTIVMANSATPGGPWGMPAPTAPITGPSGGAASPADGNKLTAVLGAVQARMQTPNFRHALELLGDNQIMSYDLVLPSGQVQTPSGFRIGTTTLDQFPFKRPSERKQIIDNIVGSWPTGAACYTLGDFVFAHTGVDISTADPGVWLVISEPIGGWPSMGAATGSVWVRMVGKADGSVDVIPVANFAAKLTEQNALRSAGGLPQLPTSTFTSPAPGTPAPTPMQIDDGF
ncbi:MAG: hypothetical protein ACREJO_09075 [Phycisphaerales bacterium]